MGAAHPILQPPYAVSDPSTGKADIGPIFYNPRCEKENSTFVLSYLDRMNVVECITRAAKAFPEQKCTGRRTLIKIHKVKIDDKVYDKLQLGNDYSWLTYDEYLKTTKDFSSGLQKLTGVDIKTNLVIYAETQQEWLMTAFAAFMRKLQVVTVYATLGASGAVFAFNQTKASILVVDAKLLTILVPVLDEIRHVKHVITLGKCDPEARAQLESKSIEVTDFYDVVALGRNYPLAPLSPDSGDDAFIMYTSGTTGTPKGVQITHANIVSGVQGIRRWVETVMAPTSEDVFLGYLPLAHIFEIVVEITCLQLGIRIGYGNPHTLTDTGVKLKFPESSGDAVVLQPTFMIFAPAVLDKIYQGIHRKISEAGAVAQYLFKKALESGHSRFEEGKVGAAPLWNALICKKLQGLVGGRLRQIVTGSSPLSKELHIFVQAIFNCPLRQGYGLTETCAGSCCQCDQAVCAVGNPTETSCIRLVDWDEGNYRLSDAYSRIGMPRGEILIGGAAVAKGYFIDPENPDPELMEMNRTDFVTLDGIRFFRTGDIGQITGVGTLEIIDRRKDLWKGPTGEYVALSKVESIMKLSKYVDAGLCMCYGKLGADATVALICASEAQIRKYGKEMNLQGTFDELCQMTDVIKEVSRSILELCKKKLAAFEVPKRIALITETWTPDNDMLTAAMKIKRPQVVEKHRAIIAALYA